IRSILQEAGYKVGSFTSPYLEVHNDRIRINDINISDEDLLRLGNAYYPIFEQFELSMFEIDTLIAILYFIEQKVDYAVMEVGLGGRLDATNIITPLVSVITTIGYDHMEILGNTLPKIALEKAGIIKPKIPVIIGEKKSSCLKVFETVCLKQSSQLILLDEYHILDKSFPLRFSYQNQTYTLDTLAIYQAHNASLAIATAKYLRTIGLDIVNEAIHLGLMKAHWKGRFEVVSSNPTIILDRAHNPHGINAMVMSLHQLNQPLVIVFTALKDKDTRPMLLKLLKYSQQIIVTTFDYYRKASVDDLALDLPVIKIEDPKLAIIEGLSLAKEGTLLITGSLYFITLVRQTLLPQVLKGE
ncbi:MAG: cyanophycin synthetase, partial [Erysipelotrichaceae bacterium]